MAMPASNNPRVLLPATRRAMIMTTTKVATAPRNAMGVTAPRPKKVKRKPKSMDTAAPRLAPEETPRMCESAKPLCKRPCRIAPAVANPAPTIAARITRGSRKRNKTMVSKSHSASGTVKSWPIEWPRRVGEMSTAPTASPRSNATAKAKERVTVSLPLLALAKTLTNAIVLGADA